MSARFPKPPWRHRLGIFAGAMGGFLGALVLFIFTLPLIDHYDQSGLVESLLLTMVLGAAVLAVGGRPRDLAVAVALVTPAIAGKWLLHFQQNPLLAELTFSTALLFVAFVILHLLRYILRAPHVNHEVMCAGIAAYLMIGLLWSLAYGLVWRLQPGAFLFSAGPAEMKGSTALYFSFVTLTTVGYGDICPVARAARMLAAVEAMTGTLFVAVLISRLVSLYSSRPPENPEGGRRQ